MVMLGRLDSQPMADRVPTADELRRKYVSLSQKLITATRYADSTNDTSIADLRAGVLLTANHVAAVANVLIRKGLITEAEYWGEQVTTVQAEVKNLHDELGPGVNLA